MRADAALFSLYSPSVPVLLSCELLSRAVCPSVHLFICLPVCLSVGRPRLASQMASDAQGSPDDGLELERIAVRAAAAAAKSAGHY